MWAEKKSQMTPTTTNTTSICQLLGAADAQTAHHATSSTAPAHQPPGSPLPTAPRTWGSALQESHCPLPLGSEAMRCRSCAAHWPQAVGQCVAGVPLPTAPGREAVYCRSTTPHCPQAMRQCETGFPLPTAPRWRGSALHCPLPSAHNNSVAGHTQCSVVHSTKQCGTTQKAQMVQRGTQGAVDQ